MLESSQPLLSPPACKICGTPSPHFFRCDLHNNAQVHFGLYTGSITPHGAQLDYYRCTNCGFVFSPFMDNWDAQKFATHIYNADYPMLDGTYNGHRAGMMANKLYLGLYDRINQLDFLDYGGGLGLQSNLLQSMGAKRAVTYDQFAAGSIRPTGRFNVTTCMEVLEHATDPQAMAKDLVSLTNLDDGFMIITTQFQPADIDAQKEKWWYVAPRVGHVAFYTQPSFARLFAPWGMKWLHIEDMIHLGFVNWPTWAERVMPRHMMGG
jgi:2-polyprenyl-6-hydroxyphenyl methylase/3-demethylubiquinone-9 3-methyltransferase